MASYRGKPSAVRQPPDRTLGIDMSLDTFPNIVRNDFIRHLDPLAFTAAAPSTPSSTPARSQPSVVAGNVAHGRRYRRRIGGGLLAVIRVGVPAEHRQHHEEPDHVGDGHMPAV